MATNVNLSKVDNSTRVKITKGATQQSLNNTLSQAKTYRDEAEAFDLSSATHESSASSSASLALSYKNSTQTYMNNASISASDSASSATSSSSSASASALSASESLVSANNASLSETNASNSATSANTSAVSAGASASAASISESNASTSETNALASETSASASATTATSAAISASLSANNASISETNASASESSAAISESNASVSATSASSSASSASISESNASASASSASTSASDASVSAISASTSASSASTSETNAANSANSASVSATNAANSEANALSYAASINPSNILHTVGNGGGNPEGYTAAQVDASLGNKVDKVISTDNAIVRFNDVNGQVQNSGITINDSDIMTFPAFPITPSSAPTSDYEVANKKYVDDNTSLYGDSDVLALFNAVGATPVYACRAWVDFNGTGTVAIRASGNVSSITDNGTGIYTANFITAMPDSNYVVINGSYDEYSSGLNIGSLGGKIDSKTVSSFSGTAVSHSGVLVDRSHMHWAFFR